MTVPEQTRRGLAHVRAQLAAGVARRPRPPAIADTPSARVAALLSSEARQVLTADEPEATT